MNLMVFGKLNFKSCLLDAYPKGEDSPQVTAHFLSLNDSLNQI